MSEKMSLKKSFEKWDNNFVPFVPFLFLVKLYLEPIKETEEDIRIKKTSTVATTRRSNKYTSKNLRF